MRRAIVIAGTVLALAAGAGGALAAQKRPASRHVEPAEKRPDLADALAGTYDGGVTSDVRGSSRNGVAVTITRVGRNQVNISSDYRRIPDTVAGLENASGSILSTTRGVTIFNDRNRAPDKLDLTVDDATYTGHRRR